jgi:hypothetical protein
MGEMEEKTMSGNFFDKQQTENPLKRPVVVLDIDALSKINRVYFVLKNCGDSPAFEISCKFDPDLPYGKDKKISDLNIFQRLHFLEQGKEIRFFYDSYLNIVKDNFPVQFSVTINYKDLYDKIYENKLFINLLVYKDILVTEEKGMNELTKEVENLRRDLVTEIRNINYNVSKELESINMNLNGYRFRTAFSKLYEQ